MQLDAVVDETPGRLLGVDCHPAHRIDRQTLVRLGTLPDGRVENHRLAYVPYGPLAALVKVDPGDDSGGVAGSFRQEDLAAGGSPETRAARLTVDPNQSPARSTAGPVM